jgi:hypothetical protein
MMIGMGFQGVGLERLGDGIKEPERATARPEGAGFGLVANTDTNTRPPPQLRDDPSTSVTEASEEDVVMKRNTSVFSYAGSSDNGTTDESTCSGRDDNDYPYTEGGGESQDDDDDIRSTVSSHFGFFDELFDGDVVQEGRCKEAEQERDAWMNYSASLLAVKSTSSQKAVEEVDVLFRYDFPNPSQYFKLSNSECREAMELSCAISGFRIAQCVSTGEITAQYGFIFCYGSRSHFSWRRFSEFRELASVLKYAKDHHSPNMFQNSLKIWSYIEYKKKMFRNLSIPYLARKTMHLQKFVESVLFESPNGALLLHFTHSQPFVTI